MTRGVGTHRFRDVCSWLSRSGKFTAGYPAPSCKFTATPRWQGTAGAARPQATRSIPIGFAGFLVCVGDTGGHGNPETVIGVPAVGQCGRGAFRRRDGRRRTIPFGQDAGRLIGVDEVPKALPVRGFPHHAALPRQLRPRVGPCVDVRVNWVFCAHAIVENLNEAATKMAKKQP